VDAACRLLLISSATFRTCAEAASAGTAEIFSWLRTSSHPARATTTMFRKNQNKILA
jgi:hypothetical protein